MRNHLLRFVASAAALLIVLGAGVQARRSQPSSEAPVSLALGLRTGGQDETPLYSGNYREVLRVGQDYTLEARDSVRELRSLFGRVRVEGRVERELFVVLGTVHVAPTAVIEGTLVSIGGNVTIEKGATVTRDLVVLGGSLTAPPDFSPGGSYVVAGTPRVGESLQAFVPWLTRGLLWGRLIVPDLGWVWVVAGLVLLVLLGLAVLFEGAVAASSEVVMQKPLSVFFIGLLVLVLTIPAIVILAATVVGLLVVPFVLAALLVAGLVGKAGVARAIGMRFTMGRLPHSTLGSLLALFLGAVVLSLAYMVPVLGALTWALTSVLALGAAAVTLRRRMRREQPIREKVTAGGPIGVSASPSLSSTAPSSAPSAEPVYQYTHAASEEAVPPPALDDVAQPAAAMPAAVPLVVERAAFLDRVAAFALDAVLVGMSVLILDLSRNDGIYPLFLLAYHVAFWSWRGTTLGGIVVGLKVAPMRGGELRFADALVRGLSSLFSIAALGIGCFWMLQDPEKQMWHDKIAGTVVVRVPRQALLA